MIFKLYYASYCISLSIYMHEVNYKLVICNERGKNDKQRDHPANLQNIQHAQYM